MFFIFLMEHAKHWKSITFCHASAENVVGGSSSYLKVAQ